jgi:hypothetical protein
MLIINAPRMYCNVDFCNDVKWDVMMENINRDAMPVGFREGVPGNAVFDVIIVSNRNVITS